MGARDDDLTEGPIYGHLWRLAVPASMGMLFNTLYNLTDLWFAGQISDAALAGLSIAGSVFFLLLGVGAGMQIGTSAVIAPEVGAKRTDGVKGWLDNAVGIALVVSVLAVGFGWAAGDRLILFLGAQADSAPEARAYLGTILLGAIFFMMMAVAAGALMALGDTKSNRDALAVGFVANWVLNPILIFGFDLGVMGLALATVLIKAGSAAYLFWVLARRLKGLARPRVEMGKWLDLLRQILPASFNMMTIILGSFITIYFIGRFGDNQVAGYNVGLRLEQVLLLPALGMNSAVMAIAGQNFGAEKPERVAETYRKALAVGLGMAAVAIPVMVFLSPTLVGVFSSDETVKATGATYLRIDAVAYFAYVVLFLSVAVLQAMKQPIFPMVLGIARQLVIPAAVNFVLIVWYGFPMMSIFITIVSVVVLAAGLTHWYTVRQIDAPVIALRGDSLRT